MVWERKREETCRRERDGEEACTNEACLVNLVAFALNNQLSAAEKLPADLEELTVSVQRTCGVVARPRTIVFHVRSDRL